MEQEGLWQPSEGRLLTELILGILLYVSHPSSKDMISSQLYYHNNPVRLVRLRSYDSWDPVILLLLCRDLDPGLLAPSPALYPLHHYGSVTGYSAWQQLLLAVYLLEQRDMGAASWSSVPFWETEKQQISQFMKEKLHSWMILWLDVTLLMWGIFECAYGALFDHWKHLCKRLWSSLYLLRGLANI